MQLNINKANSSTRHQQIITGNYFPMNPIIPTKFKFSWQHHFSLHSWFIHYIIQREILVSKHVWIYDRARVCVYTSVTEMANAIINDDARLKHGRNHNRLRNSGVFVQQKILFGQASGGAGSHGRSIRIRRRRGRRLRGETPVNRRRGNGAQAPSQNRQCPYTSSQHHLFLSLEAYASRAGHKSLLKTFHFENIFLVLLTLNSIVRDLSQK